MQAPVEGIWPEETHGLCGFLNGGMSLLARDGKRERGLWREGPELGPETEKKK